MGVLIVALVQAPAFRRTVTYLLSVGLNQSIVVLILVPTLPVPRYSHPKQVSA